MSYSYHLRPNESWGKGSVEIGSPAQQGESRVRRLQKTHDRLVTAPMEGVNTVHDVLLYASRTHGDRKAFGYRDIIDIIEEQKEVTKIVGGQEVKETKTWKYFHLSDYNYISYIELKEAVSEVARGLLKLGVQKNDVFNIYAQTAYVVLSLSPLLPFASLRFLSLPPLFHSYLSYYLLVIVLYPPPWHPHLSSPFHAFLLLGMRGMSDSNRVAPWHRRAPPKSGRIAPGAPLQGEPVILGGRPENCVCLSRCMVACLLTCLVLAQ
jgi:hypothetical protein